jgi:hypothetical protein
MIDPLLPPYETGRADANRGAATWWVVGVVVVALAASFTLALFLLAPPTAESHLTEGPVAEGTWRLDWSGSVEPPAVGQAEQTRALRLAAGGTAALVSALCLLIVAGLWRQRLLLRRGERYVHWAVGARRLQRAARLAGEGRTWAAGVLALGLLVTGAVRGMVVLSFPGDGSVPPGIASTLILLTGLGVVLVRWESDALFYAGGRSRFWELLGSPAAVGALGFAALSGVGLLTLHGPSRGGSGPHGFVVDASMGTTPESRGDAIVSWVEEVRATGMLAGLASAGTSRAAGHRDNVTTDCGRCFEGMILMPLKTIRAEVHAVAPDTFAHLGLSVERGRDFDPVLEGTTPSVAIVSRALANRHFERGQPLGRGLRVGESEWLTVVGVVGDRDDVRTTADYAVYLPIAQAQPSEIEWLLPEHVDVARVAAVAPAGTVLGAPRSRADVFAVHRWFRGLMAVLGLAALALLGAGLWVSAMNEAGATRYEVAVRRAVGAGRKALWRFYAAYAGRRVLIALAIGAWLSLFLGAGLTYAYGSIPQLDWRVWSCLGLWVAGLYVIGSAPPLVRAVDDPLVPTLDAAD